MTPVLAETVPRYSAVLTVGINQMTVRHVVGSDALAVDTERLIAAGQALWATVVDPPPSTDGRGVPDGAVIHTSTQAVQQIPVDTSRETVVVCGLVAQRTVKLASVYLDMFSWDDVDACRFAAGGWILQSGPRTVRARPQEANR